MLDEGICIKLWRMNPFEAPRLKIKQAQQHISDLDAGFTAFVKTDFYHLGIEEDVNSGDSLLKFEVVNPLSCDVPCVIGDAVHNLRSALDLLVNGIVREKLGTWERIYFPIRDSREELVTALKSGKIRQASTALCDVIVDVVKPYKGGKDAILALHELDKADKHRLLLPIIQITRLQGIDAEDNNHNVFTNLTVTVVGNKPFFAIRTSSKLHIKNYGKPAFQVVFDKGLPMEGQPIAPTLHQFAEVVSGIIDTIERSNI
jgi:hypothetical protein